MTSAINKIFGGGNDSPAPAPAPEPKAEVKEVKEVKEVPAAGPTNEKINDRTDDLATREQSLGQRASGAGATRSDNDADVLGYVLPRKRSAGRAILG